MYTNPPPPPPPYTCIYTLYFSLGAIADLDLVIRCKKIDDDIMVVCIYMYVVCVCVCVCVHTY